LSNHTLQILTVCVNHAQTSSMKCHSTKCRLVTGLFSCILMVLFCQRTHS